MVVTSRSASSTTSRREHKIHLRRPHAKQQAFIDSSKKRRIIRAGRRGGKTTGIAIACVYEFLKCRRVLYGAPTGDQIAKFWAEVKSSLREPLDAGILVKNETFHTIEMPGTDMRIRAKTCWNADTLRGDYADFLVLDEWQLMAEDTWEQVGAPMLLDNNGDAVFIYTPPSLHSRSVSKANDPMHAAKHFKRAQQDPRYDTFHFTSHDNPHISTEALEEITGDMTALAYRQEVLAEDVEEAPGALWTRETIEASRISRAPDSLIRIVVGVDPPGGATECGIVAAGIALCKCKGSEETHGFILADDSLRDSPDKWAARVVSTYNRLDADKVLGESNFGGDMVANTIRTVEPEIRYEDVHASRGKAVRAEPMAALFEQGKVHLVGEFPALESELTGWEPGRGQKSPNHLDAMVWALTSLMRQRQTISMALLE